jgi:hypothetical protein
VPTLLRNASFVLEHYVDAAFIRLARTTQPLPERAQVVHALDACRVAFGARALEQLSILVDWRLAPLAPEAEDHVVPEVEKFAAPFARKALLLLGAAGDERAAEAWVATQFQLFFDEDQAIAYVSAPSD